MSEIVFIGKHNEPYTTSKIIADRTGIEHRKIKAAIHKYKKEVDSFGLSAPYQAESTGGRPEEIYLLNEEQATFLMTLLKNTKVVVEFKKELVRQFYAMRKILQERQSTEWLLTRKQGKLVRRSETDVLAQLATYATEQGSANMEKQVYQIYTKLVNSLVGIQKGGRETAPFKTLSVIAFLEDMILNTVRQEMDNGTYYKEIYRKCKANGETIMRFAYLPTQPSLPV